MCIIYTDDVMGDIDAYLATVPEPARAVLAQLRQVIRAAAPEAQEEMVLQLPTFTLAGQEVVAFAAFKTHCCLYLHSAPLLATFLPRLEGYHTSASTIHFSPEQPLPDGLVQEMVRARLHQIAPPGKRHAFMR